MSAILIPTSSEAAWLEARRQGITASEIAVVMGLSPYSSPFALYHQKLGQLPQQADNVEMELGRYLEEFVCQKFADRRPEFEIEGNGRELYAHRDRPWQLATPDRLVLEDKCRCLASGDEVCVCIESVVAVLETKTDAGYDGWGDDGSDEIPVHYRCQVLWQMDVMGVSAGFVACLFLQSRQLRVYEITMDADAKHDLDVMHINAEWFRGRLAAQEPPDVDWRPATTDALKKLHPSLEDQEAIVPATLGSRYRAACKSLDKAKKRKALTENLIRARLGNGNRVLDGATGQTLATRQVYDLAPKTIERKASTVDKLVPARAKKEQA